MAMISLYDDDNFVFTVDGDDYDLSGAWLSRQTRNKNKKWLKTTSGKYQTTTRINITPPATRSSAISTSAQRNNSYMIYTQFVFTLSYLCLIYIARFLYHSAHSQRVPGASTGV